MAVKEMTLGQVGRALVRYQPFVAAVAAVLLIVVLVPGRDDQPAADRGVTAGPTAPAAQRPGTAARPAAGQQPAGQQPGATPAAGGTTTPGGATTGGGTTSGGAVTAGGGTTGGGGAPAAVGAGGETTAAEEPGAETGPAPADDGAAAPAPVEGFGPNCDPATGRVRIPSIYAPTCVTPWDGTPAPASYQGVFPDKVIVAVYDGQDDPAVSAILTAAGADDSSEQVRATRQAFIDLYAAHLETYGRTVELHYVEGSGEATDDAAAKSDAIKVATEIKAFISLGSPNNVYVDELAARGVSCFCTVSQPIENYLKWAPYVISPGLMASTQGYIHRAEYIGKKLAYDAAGAPQKAKHAGDTLYTTMDRAFGLIYFEDRQQAYKAGADFFEVELAKYNVRLTDRVEYLFDLPRSQEQARTIIGRFKDKGITSVVFAGDPIYPIFYTQEATKQAYRPEWIITGSALTDTTFFARTYDQTQWTQAFGISYLPARGPQEDGDAYRLHVWHHGRPPEADDSYGVIYPSPATLMAALHYTGPNLTPQTFRDALFNIAPASGGAFRNPSGITSVAISYGPAGELWPWDDYLAFDDATEIWWDPAATGRDEIGNQGRGMYQYVEGGRRFLPTQWPAGEPKAFNREGAVTIYDKTPDSDRWPEYEHQPH